MGNMNTIADFNCFDCTDRHDCLREHGIQLFKNRIAETGRDTCDAAFNHAAGTVLIFHTFFKISTGFSSSICVRPISLPSA